MSTAPTNPLLKHWFLSLGSNVHVCNDRQSFTKFVEFKSHAGQAPNTLEVHGIGQVELVLEGEDDAAGHKLVLPTVLFV